jgi:fatty-acyl-CoA synthase
MTSTFKPKKTQLVAEGFDPARTAEPVFFDDRGAGAYRPVDAALLDGLEAGTVRL